MKIIAFTGKAGVGKDTAADHLVEKHGFVKRGFADPLYEEVAHAFGVTVERLRDRSTKETMVDWLSLRACYEPKFVAMILDSDEKELDTWCSPRYVLQKWGTEYRRGMSNAYWIDKMTDFSWSHQEAFPYRTHVGLGIAIPDCRFENEAQWVKRAGGIIVRIIRDVPGVAGHPSESGFPESLVDFTIMPPNDIESARKALDAVLVLA
jgi:hypothetical protein